MQRFHEICRQSGAGLVLFAGVMLPARPAWAAAGDGGAGVAVLAGPAGISGVVRDAQGMAQMGALVQVLAANSITVATAFTDLHGHYSFSHLIPGKYQVRASAALFVPTTRANLQLRTGGKAVVDLTLAALFDTASWLPASRRRADEPEDEWQWTLRSTANRPILRILDDDGVLVVSEVPETTRPRVVVREALSAGDGFGDSGIRSTLSLHRSYANGTEGTVRAKVGTSLEPGVLQSAGGAVEMAAGLDRKTGYGGGSRTVIGFSAHPELVGTGRCGWIAGAGAAQRAADGAGRECRPGGWG